jgi:DNA-binding MarR family transcriptional regulator
VRTITTGSWSYPVTGLGWPEVTAPPRPVLPDGGERREAGSRQAAPGLPAPLESGLGFRLGRAHRMLRGAWEEAIADLGLTAPQAALLRAVAQRPGSGLRELARQVCTDAMNAKRLADHLERAGLVSSAPDPGHRQRRVFRPAGSGAAIAAELARRAAAHDRLLASALGTAELAGLQRLLDRLDAVLASRRPRPQNGTGP